MGAILVPRTPAVCQRVGKVYGPAGDKANYGKFRLLFLAERAFVSGSQIDL